MLRAYSTMPADEFIAQLRVYVIAMGLSPAVVDCVDDLTGIGEFEDKHAEELETVEQEAEKRGRESMKEEIINDVTSALNRDPDLSADQILTLLDDVEV